MATVTLTDQSATLVVVGNSYIFDADDRAKVEDGGELNGVVPVIVDEFYFEADDIEADSVRIEGGDFKQWFGIEDTVTLVEYN